MSASGEEDAERHRLEAQVSPKALVVLLKIDRHASEHVAALPFSVFLCSRRGD